MEGTEMTIPLPLYLAVLRSATPTDNPQVQADRLGAEHTGPAFAAMTNAIADFVDACREHDPEGYVGAREVLEGLVHRFPVEEQPDPIAAFKARLSAMLGIPVENIVTSADLAKTEEVPADAAPLDPDAFAKALDEMPSAEDPFDLKGGDK
jgi:hypothetical protein